MSYNLILGQTDTSGLAAFFTGIKLESSYLKGKSSLPLTQVLRFRYLYSKYICRALEALCNSESKTLFYYFSHQ
jgi:hypothetical protein